MSCKGAGACANVTTQVLSLERRMASVETLATTRSEILKTAIETVSWDHAAKLSQMAGDLQRTQSTTEEAARDLALAKDRQASLEARVESIEEFSRRLNAANETSRLQATEDLALIKDLQASLQTRMESIEESNLLVTANQTAYVENRMASIEQIATEQASLEKRITWIENSVDGENHDRDHLFDRLVSVEKRIEWIDQMIEQHDQDMRSANDRLASLENRMESMTNRLASLENRMDSVVQFTDQQLTGLSQGILIFASVSERQGLMQDEVQDLQIATEQAARDLVSANDRQASLERRMESIETLTNVEMAGKVETLQAATEQAARDLISASDRQASLENHIAAEIQALQTFVEQIAGKLQAELIAAEHAARDRHFETCMESCEKLTKEQIADELQALPTATEQAARDVLSESEIEQIAGEDAWTVLARRLDVRGPPCCL